MAIKYKRQSRLEEAKAQIEERRGRLTRKKPHKKRFSPFLLLYAGIAAFVVMSLYLSSVTRFATLRRSTVEANATVLERTKSAAPDGSTVYRLRLNIIPPLADSFTGDALVDEKTWDSVKEGDRLVAVYQPIQGGRKHVILGLRRPEVKGTELNTEAPKQPDNGPHFESIPMDKS